ncbi:MAG TPA: M1 family metallopeptidase [Gemmatimonadales bacterium]|nr:M1 family metallopeptidase [Gemmatimonadales bacterium]
MRFAPLSMLPALLVPVLLGAQAQAPTLYTPRAVARAYQAGTRTISGRPGPNYWQNHARYTIAINVAPPARTVTGAEQITYVNDSPDTLKALVFRLIVNIHKAGAPRAFPAGEDYLTPGVQVDSFTVNGAARPWGNDAQIYTLHGVRLTTPLAPHDSARVTLNWHYDLSRASNREGMLDSTTAYLAYFYPRIDVYDDYDGGWDGTVFTDMQEFYSDFNDYDVSVRVPANFIVWGTGTLTNPDQVLTPEYARRLRASMTSDSTIRIATQEDLNAHRVTRADGDHTWHFTATHIPDMTFAVSDHYDWDGGSVVVDDATGRRASVQAAYNDTSADYHHMVQYGRHALAWFSRNWPGVPYPYEKSTVVEGRADMEYPMMVNDNSFADTVFARFVVEHEMSHSYFPFYMGINESRYAFMDEGWATTLEYLIGQVDLGPARAAELFRQFRVNGWAGDPSPLEDLPIITPNDAENGQAYGNNAYGKPALGYLALKDMLGDAAFGKALHEYMDRWHGRHPIPWDFFYTFNDVTGKNLDWFWNSWYFSNDYIDLAVNAVKATPAGTVVTVGNIGGMPAPFDVLVKYGDGSEDSVHETAAVWERTPRAATVTFRSKKKVSSVTLLGGIWVDADSSNNRWSAK